MNTVEIVIGEKPVSASRPRVARNGGVFYPKNVAQYIRRLHDWLKEAPELRLGEGAKYWVSAEFVFPPLKTSKYPIPRSDVDNLFKLPIDVMSKIGRWWKDDHQIVYTEIIKRFAGPEEKTHTRIVVGQLEEPYDD